MISQVELNLFLKTLSAPSVTLWAPGYLKVYALFSCCVETRCNDTTRDDISFGFMPDEQGVTLTEILQ